MKIKMKKEAQGWYTFQGYDLEKPPFKQEWILTYPLKDGQLMAEKAIFTTKAQAVKAIASDIEKNY